jgi:hypothetical protein
MGKGTHFIVLKRREKRSNWSSLALNNLPMDGIMIQSVGGVISRTLKAAAKRKNT